jgi:hypothetical protein
MKRFLILIFSLISFAGFSQIAEDFTDGDFTSNPIWTGDAAEFTINGTNQLQLNNTIAGSSYLTTPNSVSLLGAVEWTMYVKQTFAPSSSNFGRVYLVSDQANLESALNGYYLQFGEAGSTDAIELFKQIGLTSTSIARGTPGQIAASFTVGVKVSKDASGLWTLLVDATGGTNYILEATGNDASITNTSFFGVSTVYTLTNANKFFYDDFTCSTSVSTDTIAPELVSSSVISSTQLDILFNEPVDTVSAEKSSNYFVNNSIGNPATAERDASNLALVHLSFALPFPNGQTDSLFVDSIQDLSSNLRLADTLTFVYTAPIVAAYKDILINEIFADPIPVVGLPNAEFLEIFNRSASPLNLNQWSFTDNLSSNPANIGNYTLQPDSFLIVCATSSLPAFAAFSNVIGISSFPSLVNTGNQIYLKSNTGVLIDSVDYSDSWYQNITKAQGGWSLELINPFANPNCSVAANWIASNAPSGGTPGAQNSVFSTTADVTSPALSSINVNSSTQISICFDESINLSQIAAATNYAINSGVGNPSSLNVYNNSSCVTLNLSTALVSQQVNTITFSNLADCSGNLLSTASANFTYFAPVVAGFKDVIINEIYSSPNATSGLPNAEYVELFNRSTSIINLNDWSFYDNISSLTPNLPNYILKPDSLVVLCSSTMAGLFAGIPNLLPISSFPVLNNSGDFLYLRSDLVTIIDSVPYTASWYQDPVKAAGGWSLELINPGVNVNCAPEANWIASTNGIGGTPGFQNSVYSTVPDLTSPTISSIIANDSTHLTICFSEAIDASQIGILVNYFVNNGIGNPLSAQANSTLTCVVLTFANNFVSQQINTINFSSISDCSGNLLSPASATFTYFAPVQTQIKDILINEIYSSPLIGSSLPNAEYVELYNRSTNPINLNNWSLHDDINDLSPNIGNYVLLPDTFVVLCNVSNVSLFSAYPNVLGISSFPSLNNSGDHLYLRNESIVIIDSVPYTDDWYRDSQKSGGGWSLELINPNQNANCAPEANWIASTNTSGGTPGNQNSVFSNSPDITPPSIISVIAIDSVHVTMCFSEAIDASQIAVTSNYTINGGIGNPNSIVANVNLTCADLTLNQSLVSQQIYTITLSGIGDCSGNLLVTNTINFVYYKPVLAKSKEVIITEIYSSPTATSGLPNAEYIEIFNRSEQPINLGGWSIRDDVTNTSTNIANYILFPDSFLILCGLANQALFASNLNVLGIISFPSLNNSGDHIYLRNNLTNLVDDVNYSDTWYRNNTKKEGGWSLELIDRDFLCNNSLNWIASTNANGGTPGKINSVNGIFTDTQAPILDRAIVTSNSSVKLFFDEPVSYAALVNINTYSFDNGIILPPGTQFVVSEDSTNVNIALPFQMQLKTIYTVTVSAAIKDCSGNSVSSKDNTARFGLWEEPEFNDVVLNEILADPITNGTDYVEIYNRSNKIIDLSQLILSAKDTVTNELKTLYTIAPEGYLLFPGSYLLLSENSATVKAQYLTTNPKGFLQMESLPSFNISVGAVVLSTPQQKIIDDLVYYDSWQFPLLVSTKGVALERINYNRNTQDDRNWHSASQNVGFGTPAYRNSQFSENLDNSNDEITIDPEVFSPDNDGYQDVVNIIFKSDNPGNTGTITIFDSRGRLIRNLVKNELWGNAGTYSWDGITNDNDKARIGIYVVLVEVFDVNGNSKQYKKSCVLGAKL